jgi:RimJ/RimL family protein N-acetyltransferase
MIERIAPTELDVVRPLLAQSPHAPLRFLARDIPGEVAAHWFDEIAGWVRSGDGEVFVAEEGGRLAGMAVYSALPWDAALFRQPMGAIRYVVLDASAPASLCDGLVAAVESWARAREVVFLLGRAHTDDIPLIHAMERNGFLLMDTLLDYVYDMRRQPLTSIVAPSVPAGFSIGLASERDLDRLTHVARAAFVRHFGRYNADPRITPAQSMQVYEEWVRSSVRGYADWIVIAECDGAIAGYSIWRRPSAAESALGVRVGHYSIAGVHPDFGGRGLFGVLTHAGMELLQGIADCVEGPTHVNNYPVQRGYARLSWHIADARHSFHKWLAG